MTEGGSPRNARTGCGVGPATGEVMWGLYPYVLDNPTLTALHGNDERVRVTALRQGAELLYRMFGSFVLGGTLEITG